jgi:hypothetical protein
MARTLKGTRARGLPPKVLLSQQQNATGSFPTTWRTSSDNRTGRYPVFFNDNKVLVYNQPVTDVGVSAATYSQYEEKFINVGSSGNPVTGSIITFDYAFSGTPVVGLTELTPSTNTPTVNAFVKALTSTGMTVEYSAPFEGTIVYRAIYQPVQGVPVNVLRSPRFADQYSLVVAKYGSLTNSHIDINFSDFGSIPTENYIVFRDFTANNRQNISGSITYISNTSIAVTGSASGLGSTIMHYMGFGASTLTNNDISVKGIVYPLLMDTQTMADGLSVKAMGDLFKQPYFSGSEIVNQPIVASGSLQKGISDIFVTFTPGQDIQPFQDFSNPEVDGKISASIGGVNPFYATGSAVEVTGLGFQQPLWSKNKIEIDITPVAEQTINVYYRNTYSNSYPMFYWNPSTKQYEGLGDGVGLEAATGNLTGLRGFLEEKTVGFGGCLDNGALPSGLQEYAFKIRNRPISNFGFPYHPKFAATSSQLIDMKNYISEPFLLEKIVLEFSGSISVPLVETNVSIQTFFLLNQRSYVPSKSIGEQIISYATGALLAPWTASFITSSYSGRTYQDLVDYMQIAFYKANGFGPTGLAQSPRELNFLDNPNNIGPTNFIISSSCKSPIKFEEGIRTFFSGAVLDDRFYIEKNEFSGRNGANEVNGREWLTSYENPVIVGTASYYIGGPDNIIDINAAYTKLNPYVLLPTDKLTFGGQLPLSLFGTNVGDQSSITFSPQGINKIILYGSTLRVNPETNQLEEYHDTLNQLLSSESIHEVISG